MLPRRPRGRALFLNAPCPSTSPGRGHARAHNPSVTGESLHTWTHTCVLGEVLKGGRYGHGRFNWGSTACDKQKQTPVEESGAESVIISALTNADTLSVAVQ